MNSPFKVPDGFFEAQKQDILNHVSDKGARKSKRRITTALAVAASLTLFFILLTPIQKEICVTFSCLLDQTDFEQLSDQDSQLIDEWVTEFEYLDLYELEF